MRYFGSERAFNSLPDDTYNEILRSVTLATGAVTVDLRTKRLTGIDLTILGVSRRSRSDAINPFLRNNHSVLILTAPRARVTSFSFEMVNDWPMEIHRRCEDEVDFFSYGPTTTVAMVKGVEFVIEVQQPGAALQDERVSIVDFVFATIEVCETA
jgi:hypothetical protein